MFKTIYIIDTLDFFIVMLSLTKKDPHVTISFVNMQ